MSVVWPIGLALSAMEMRHLDGVLSIERAVYPFPWSRGNFADSLTGGHYAWVLSEAGQVLAYTVATVVLDEAQLLNITVSPLWQCRGLGAALLRHVMHEVKNKGACSLFLEARFSNVRAMAVYRRAGFISVGIRKAYYPALNGREDAWVLRRDLSDVEEGKVIRDLDA